MKARVAELQQLMILECRADENSGRLRKLSRKALLDEVHAVSVPPCSFVPAGTLLQARDVRKVDPLIAARLEPAIIVRTGCITVSLGRTELRAIITRERLYFVVPDGADSILTLVQDNLALLRACDSLHAPDRKGDAIYCGIPFELAALEAMLMTACSTIHHQQTALFERVNRALHALRRTVIGSRVVAGDKQLEVVRELKQEVRELQLQAQALERVLERTLEEDEDMEKMHLTRLHKCEQEARSSGGGERANGQRLSGQRLGGSTSGPASPSPDGAEERPNSLGHDEVETMFESYVQVGSFSLSALSLLPYPPAAHPARPHLTSP